MCCNRGVIIELCVVVGNKRKLSVAMAMIGDPSIVFLDGNIYCVLFLFLFSVTLLL